MVLLLVSAMALAVAAPAAAQKPTFDLDGVVTDAQQGVLPGATVTLQNVANGLSRETATDANGRYVFTSLPPAGQYILQTSLAGFASERRENLTFNAGQHAVRERHAQAVVGAGNGDRLRRLAGRPDDERGGDPDDREPGPRRRCRSPSATISAS